MRESARFPRRARPQRGTLSRRPLAQSGRSRPRRRVATRSLGRLSHSGQRILIAAAPRGQAQLKAERSPGAVRELPGDPIAGGCPARLPFTCLSRACLNSPPRCLGRGRNAPASGELRVVVTRQGGCHCRGFCRRGRRVARVVAADARDPPAVAAWLPFGCRGRLNAHHGATTNSHGNRRATFELLTLYGAVQ
jgi:hypothetical protein